MKLIGCFYNGLQAIMKVIQMSKVEIMNKVAQQMLCAKCVCVKCVQMWYLSLSMMKPDDLCAETKTVQRAWTDE